MKILELYQAIVESLGVVVEDDLFYYMDEEKQVPLKHKAGGVSRQLVLPTYQRIKDGFVEELHPFHPLCESVIEGQSPTVKFMRKLLLKGVQENAGILITHILAVACGPRKPRSTVFADLIAKVTEGIKNPKFDDTLMESWGIVSEELVNTKLVRIYLNVNQDIDGVKYSRACNYDNKFEEETDDKSQFFFGAKLKRKADKVILLRLAQEIFAMMPSETGSNDDRPYFASMARAWREFVSKYNKIAHSMKEVRDVPKLNDTWFEAIDDLEQFENKIQTLELNAGEGKKKAPEPATIADLQKPVTHTPPSASESLPPEPGKLSIMDLAGQRTPSAGGTLNTEVMSAAERRSRESQQSTSFFQQPTSPGPSGMFSAAPQQQGGMFTPQQSNMFGSTQQDTQPSLFDNQPSLFGQSAQPSSMFDKPASGTSSSMFNGGTGSIFKK